MTQSKYRWKWLIFQAEVQVDHFKKFTIMLNEIGQISLKIKKKCDFYVIILFKNLFSVSKYFTVLQQNYVFSLLKIRINFHFPLQWPSCREKPILQMKQKWLKINFHKYIIYFYIVFISENMAIWLLLLLLILSSLNFQFVSHYKHFNEHFCIVFYIQNILNQ